MGQRGVKYNKGVSSGKHSLLGFLGDYEVCILLGSLTIQSYALTNGFPVQTYIYNDAGHAWLMAYISLHHAAFAQCHHGYEDDATCELVYVV